MPDDAERTDYQTFEGGQGLVFLGKELAQGHNYSEAVAARIDDEVGKL